STISSMKTRNRKGERTAPCGVPARVANHSEARFEWTTRMKRLSRKDLSQAHALPLTPSLASFHKRPGIHTRSKAALISRKAVDKYAPRAAIARDTAEYKRYILCNTDTPGRKPV